MSSRRLVLFLGLFTGFAASSGSTEAQSPLALPAPKNDGLHAGCLIQIRKLLGSAEVRAQEASARIAGKASNKAFRIRPLRGDEKVVQSFTKGARDLFQGWNGHLYPIGAFDEAADALAWARYAAWEGNQNLLTDAEKEVLRAAKETIEVGDDGTTKVGKVIHQYVSRIKGYRAEQQTHIDHLAQIQYEIEVIRKLFGDFKPGGLGKLPTFGRTRFLTKFPVEGIVHEIPAFGTRAADQTTFQNVMDAQLRLQQLLRDRAGLLRQLSDRAIEQATLLKKLETYNQIFIQEVAAAERKFKVSDAKSPKEHLDLFKLFKELRQDGNPVQTNYKPEYMPPTWTWNKIRRIQLTQEVLAFFKSRAKAANNPKLANKVEKIQEFLEALLRMNDQMADRIGLTRFKRDVDTVKGWRWYRVTTAGLPIFGTVAGGGYGAFKFLPWFEQWNETLFAGRIKRHECVTAQTDRDFVFACTEYLKIRFPAKTILANEEWIKMIESGEVTDKELLSELDEIQTRRNKYFHDLNLREEFAEALLRRISMHDPMSEGFRLRMYQGDLRDPGEIKAGKSQGLKFYEVMLAPADQKGYLRNRHANAMKFPVIVEMITKKTKVVDACYLDELGLLRFKNQVDSKIPLTQIIKNMGILDLNYCRELIIDAYEKKVDDSELSDEDLAKFETVYEENLRNLETMISNQSQALQNYKAAQDKDLDRWVPGLASDMNDILLQRYSSRRTIIDNARTIRDMKRTHETVQKNLEDMLQNATNDAGSDSQDPGPAGSNNPFGP